ncbi:MAG: class I adenylate-forming enzyme family protein [Pseudomonadota bacterium]
MSNSQLLPQRFLHSASTHGDKAAIVYRGRQLSYRELFETAQKVAGFLRHAGMAQGDRVALLVQNSPEYIAAYYGVWMAGGISVALNTQASVTDVLTWVRHSEASILFVDLAYANITELFERLIDVRVVTVDTLHTRNEAHKQYAAWNWQNVLDETPLERIAVCAAQAPAAIIYTSGTTGAPKGVTLSHANLTANTASIIEYLELSARDSIMNVLPFFYSYGNSVLHTHLTAGGTIFLENSLAYPHQVMDAMARACVTGFAGVPSTFALLMNRVDLHAYDLSSVRYMTQAGGSMPVTHIERLRAAIPKIKLIVMYGQTEATARLAYLPPERLDEKLGSAGKAIPGVCLEIRDEQGLKLGAGEKGEIYARGDNIMLGYWRNAEVTQTVIVGGWLRTGDLAYMDGDGYIFIHGRSSEIIKTGAFRVSPLEIEEVILEMPEIAEVAAVGVADDILGEVIKVAVVVKSNCSIEQRAIQAYCRRRLPAYKVPKIVEFRDALPKTATGKVRRALLVNKQKEGL